MGRYFEWDRVNPDPSRNGTIIIPLCSKAVSAKKRPNPSIIHPSIHPSINQSINPLLSVGVGDALVFDHNGHAFSTADADSDGSQTANCAQKHKGGWWYSNCFKSNLNGVWGKADETGIVWGPFNNWQMYALKETKMMVRPVDCDWVVTLQTTLCLWICLELSFLVD